MRSPTGQKEFLKILFKMKMSFYFNFSLVFIKMFKGKCIRRKQGLGSNTIISSALMCKIAGEMED